MKQRLDSRKSRIQIFDYEEIISKTYKSIENELSESNVILIKKYDSFLISDSLSNAYRSKTLSTLLGLSRMLEKNWKDATKDDFENLVPIFVKKFGDNGQETNTTVDYKKNLKRFFRWIKFDSRNWREVGDPPETKWIHTRKPKETVTADMLITPDEKTRMLEACGENQRDRAFIHCIIEAGGRTGELLSRQIKHLKFDKYGAILSVDGKTGPRPLRLVECAPDLADYYNKHPHRENLEGPLWIMISITRYGDPLTYAAMRGLIKRVCIKAKISKRIWATLFRHTEATVTANYLTDAQTKKRHGWSPNSKMPGRYEHLIHTDVDNAILSKYGLKENDTDLKKNLPKMCHVCQMPNSPDSTICSKCGKPLDIKTALEKEEQDQEVLQKIQKDMEEINLKQQRHEIADSAERESLQKKIKELEEKLKNPDR